MFSWKKNFVVILLTCLCLRLTSTMPVNATEALEPYSNSQENATSIDEFAFEQMQMYLRASMSNSNANYMSNAFSVQDIENARDNEQYVYFALSNNEIVGHLYVYVDEGIYSSSYVDGPYDMPVGLCDKAQIYFYKDELILRTDSGNYHLGGKENGNYLDERLLFDLQTINKLYSLPVSTNIQTRMTYYYLPVPYVANTSVNGNGICWAACVASRVNYHQGSNLTAQNVYDACNAVTSERPTGTPSGTSKWLIYGFSLYGINTTSEMSGKNFGQICSLLASDKPICCGFGSSSANHEILLIGVYQEGSSNIYMFRDSNEQGVVSVNQSSEALTDYTKVVYTCGSDTYNEWFRSVY